MIPVARQADHHHLITVRSGAKQLGQTQVAAVEVDDLAELVGGTGDSNLDGGKAIGPDSIGQFHDRDGKTSSLVHVNTPPNLTVWEAAV